MTVPAGSGACVVGAGYLGRRIAEALSENGAAVTVTARSAESLAALGSRFAAARLDLADPSTFSAIPPDVRLVALCPAPAGKTAADYDAVYARGVPALCAFLARRAAPPRLVYTSSTAVNHVTDGSVVTEETPVDAGVPKRAALCAAESAATAPPLSGIVLRLGGIYGPGRNRLDDTRFQRVSMEGLENFANTIHVVDAARAAVFLMEKGHRGEIYIGVDTRPTRRLELYRWLAGEIGVAFGAAPGSETAGRRAENKRCSSAKLQALGFEFRYPTFVEGYRAVIAAEGERGTN